MKENLEEDMKTNTPAKDAEMLRKIEEATKKLDAANALYEKNRQLAEEARVNKVLEGVGEAGMPAEKKESTPAEYAQKVMAGELE